MAATDPSQHNSPEMQPRDEGTDYDLAPDSRKVTRVRSPLVEPAQPPPGSPRTLAYRAPKEETPARSDPETVKNLYMPLWLLAGGVVIEVAAAFIRTRDPQRALTYVGVNVVVGTVVMLVGMLLAARFRGIDLGNVYTAAFKLAAVSVAPGAIMQLFYPLLLIIPFLGFILALVAHFCLYFALLGALFDLDQEDTWYCVCVIFLIRLAVYFTLKSL